MGWGKIFIIKGRTNEIKYFDINHAIFTEYISNPSSSLLQSSESDKNNFLFFSTSE